MQSNCFMSAIRGMDRVWQGWITQHTTKQPPTTPWTCSAVTLLLRPKSLNHAPHQSCSGTRTMTQVWICCPTMSWVFGEVWITFDRSWSPHRPQYYLQLHPWHTQMVPWFSKRRTWTMYLSSHLVVQGWWHRYGYATPLFYGCYTRHGSCLTGVITPRPLRDLQIHPGHAQLLPGFFRKEKILNNVYHQWYSGPSKMIHV